MDYVSREDAFIVNGRPLKNYKHKELKDICRDNSIRLKSTERTISFMKIRIYDHFKFHKSSETNVSGNNASTSRNSIAVETNSHDKAGSQTAKQAINHKQDDEKDTSDVAIENSADNGSILNTIAENQSHGSEDIATQATIGEKENYKTAEKEISQRDNFENATQDLQVNIPLNNRATLNLPKPSNDESETKNG